MLYPSQVHSISNNVENELDVLVALSISWKLMVKLKVFRSLAEPFILIHVDTIELKQNNAGFSYHKHDKSKSSQRFFIQGGISLDLLEYNKDLEHD